MNRRLNTGQLLVWGGAAITLTSVIAGFVLVGGPGDARNRRLDEITMGRIQEAIAVAQCALNTTGIAPLRIEEAWKIRPMPTRSDPAPALCGGLTVVGSYLATGEVPRTPGDVVYRMTGDADIRICGNFRTQTTAREAGESLTGAEAAYPELGAGHAAGIHCYDVRLAPQPEGPAPGRLQAGESRLPE